MNRFSLIIIGSLFVVALLFDPMMTNQTSKAGAATVNNHTGSNSTRTDALSPATPCLIPPTRGGVVLPSFIFFGSRYVSIGTNFVASVDGGIDTGFCMTKATTAQVRISVASYNAQPLSARQFTGSSSVILSTGLPTGCSPNFTSYTVLHWWGYQLFLNECDTILLQDNVDVVNGVIAVALAPVCAIGLPVCATIIAVLTGYLQLSKALIKR